MPLAQFLIFNPLNNPYYFIDKDVRRKKINDIVNIIIFKINQNLPTIL